VAPKSQHPQPQHPQPQRTLGFLIHDVARLLRKRFEQRARDLGLTRSQWQVLAWLSQHEGIHQNGLAELIEIEPITLARIVDRLAAPGLVERRPHPRDRRIRLLHTLPAAHGVLEQMWAIAAATREEALSAVPAGERERLMELLLSIKSNLIRACAGPAARAEEASHG
jgi:MarR family transcriptional regulator, transcriptional regulator for hemolysin